MNVYDSARIHEMFAGFGLKSTENIAEADVLLFNGCNIREKAASKLFSDVGRAKKAQKKVGKKGIYILAGCVGQATHKEAFSRGLDIVVGPRSYHKIPDLLKEKIQKEKMKLKGGVMDVSFAKNEKFENRKVPQLRTSQSKVSVFLTIQEGCNKFCRFCCVPYTRGREFSRPVDQIYREAKDFVSQGAREITLLGQNVSDYQYKDENQTTRLGNLIRKVSDIEDLWRLRYTTSHPRDIDDELISAHAEVRKLMPHLHLPVQSGSNKLLKEMNRKHSIERYLEIIDQLRKARPGILFSTDIIVAYPGETEEDFQATMDLVEKVKFAQVYSFKYSPRKRTPAASMVQIPLEVQNERLQRLQSLTNKHQEEINKSFIGKTLSVLVEKKGKYKNQNVGFSQYMQPVAIDNSTEYFGKIVDVKITEVLAHTLKGEII